MLMELDVAFNPMVPRLACDAEKPTIRERNRANDNELLHAMPHITLDYYLHQLQHCCEMLSNYSPMVIWRISVKSLNFT